MNGTIRYYDASDDGYVIGAEKSGEIIADATKFVTVDTGDRTFLVPVENTIHIEIEREA